MKRVPFRVLCVKRVNFDIVAKVPFTSPISVGSEYTVIDTLEESGRLWYALEGFDPEAGFDARLFATLPDPATEVSIEGEHEAIIYQR